jgi:hypothetical protein
MDIFQEAYKRAFERAGENVWDNMHSHQQTELLYAELRTLGIEETTAAKSASQSASGYAWRSWAPSAAPIITKRSEDQRRSA